MVRTVSDNDATYYSDASNLKPGRRVGSLPPPTAAMKEHVPIRFSAAVIAQVKTLAAEDGATVSSWIRRLVLHEIERRSRPRSVAGAYESSWIAFSFSSPIPDATIATARLTSEEQDPEEISA
jgi:hypothetical protein